MPAPCTRADFGCDLPAGHRGAHRRPVAAGSRTTHPDPLRRVRTQLLALAERLVGTLELRTAIEGARRLEARDPEPDVLLVRHLTVEHLGRWVYLPGRPAQLGPAGVAEPSLAAAAGRLVGIRPGKAGTRDQPATRTLIVQAGTLVGELPVRVDDRVDVAPREWSL